MSNVVISCFQGIFMQCANTFMSIIFTYHVKLRGDTMNKNIFSKRLKDLREEKSITKTQLAEKIGCDQPKISKLENPESTTFPSVDNLIALADYFGVSIDYLLGIEKKQQNEIRSFADIIQRLFDIDEATNISLNQHTKEYFESRGFEVYPELFERDVHQLGFEQHGDYGFYLDDFMKSWKKTKDYLSGQNGEIGEKLYELWKKDQLENAASKSILPWDGFLDIPDASNEELPFN